MGASLRAFAANLAGASAALARYGQIQLFEYRVRLALEGASLIKPLESRPIRSDGLTFYVRSPIEAVMATARHEGGLLGQFAFKKGGVFLDVGAHIGVYSLRAAKSGMAVECWEPDPSNRAILVKNFAANELAARIHPEALGDEPGVLQLHLSNEQSSFILQGGRSVAVRVVTLDSYELDRVDLVKIDTEGFEAEVVRGARKTLARHKPTLIIELHPFYAPESGVECSSQLREIGYRDVRVFTSGSTRYLIARGS